ncbi:MULTISPECIES: riboflavin synthase [unclassified Colwellia]|uniref:riboflavin synthase n=1 Tax=unclassified Colwellia TaxID=196834 RepID=UPI0015F61034|nr:MULTISPECIES: riboflavin synthase [unclassified Colwellia]MBA6230652.1 riboflavin synthase [Colwellia sp. MB02u-7]MBA6234583.1 riboflavin synthase [Colwellia sp. MB02u-11]MBA6255447.1 riboflavin synthase [Colwellia sp. MB3u-28]MBA6261587.1 riboflavin synthase [Colwellia sp. MB3u-41]MBA6301137.1 riboflavin synthase [Colwellia sp. MB3u-22]
MFTGIIEAVGTIQAINITGQGARLVISSGLLDMSDVKLGDSIATNGICLTVVAFDSSTYSVDVSNETLTRTGFVDYQTGQSVNLEKAMLPTTRFGGHMVSGHVDAVVAISSIEHNGNSIEYWLEMPSDLAPYIAEKGSITIDGTSLTVNSVTDNQFRLTIVPHTTAQTIIAHYKVGTKVNLEVDLIARYIERLLTKKDASTGDNYSGGVTHDLLARSGFMK